VATQLVATRVVLSSIERESGFRFVSEHALCNQYTSPNYLATTAMLNIRFSLVLNLFSLLRVFLDVVSLQVFMPTVIAV
jgi:hypothetical protein